MTLADELSAADREHVARLGIAAEEIERQLGLYRRPPRSLRLLRPCRNGDGIVRLERGRRAELIARSAAAAAAGRFLAFIPASGAASRMFETLLPLLREPPVSAADLERRAGAGERAAADLLRLCAHLPEFAFHDELAAAVRARGSDPEALLADGDFSAVLGYLLGAAGLSYAERPKALIKFHHSPAGGRPALTEQLIEGAGYLADDSGTCRFHFTVAPEQAAAVAAAVGEAAATLLAERGVRAEVGLSPQDRSTDILAVDVYDRPFRTADGALLFRPGGHGALLRNLQATGGDLVFVKNIDNVVPDRRKLLTARWKRVLAGHCLALQEEVFRHLAALAAATAGEAEVAAAESFVERGLELPLPAGRAEPPASRRAALVRLLDRPLRVCGMVPNHGEPGGGPFWVRDRAGGVSRQIVEFSEVDHDSDEQRAIWAAATHFNPVDLVCALRDRHGRPYELARFSDPEAVFISTKSADGRRLKALEHPGLWNGGMAGWNTVFVEVPAETFAPVKSLFDLLRPEHRGP